MIVSIRVRGNSRVFRIRSDVFMRVCVSVCVCVFRCMCLYVCVYVCVLCVRVYVTSTYIYNPIITYTFYTCLIKGSINEDLINTPPRIYLSFDPGRFITSCGRYNYWLPYLGLPNIQRVSNCVCDYTHTHTHTPRPYLGGLIPTCGVRDHSLSAYSKGD